MMGRLGKPPRGNSRSAAADRCSSSSLLSMAFVQRASELHHRPPGRGLAGGGVYYPVPIRMPPVVAQRRGRPTSRREASPICQRIRIMSAPSGRVWRAEWWLYHTNGPPRSSPPPVPIRPSCLRSRLWRAPAKWTLCAGSCGGHFHTLACKPRAHIVLLECVGE